MGAHSNLGVFSDFQEIDAATLSDNMIDMAVTNPQFGVGHPIHLCIRTSVAPTNTADSLSIELQTSATQSGDDLSGTIKTIMMPLAGVINAGSGVNEVIGTDSRLLLAGAWIYRGALPYGLNQRYLQLYYNQTITNGTFTIDAWLEDVPQSDRVQVAVSPVGNP
jgi:hypothetical protein